MATAPFSAAADARGEARFFFIMACVMAVCVAGGFSMQLARGFSSLALPTLYHVHAIVFFGFVALYVTQNTLVLAGNNRLHRALGWLALLFIPAMFVLGIWLTFTTLRVLGGPPFFAQAEFLFVNIAHISAFAGLAAASVVLRRRTDWHRRLMFGAMATVAAPGVARLLPLPLLMPYVFPALFAASSVFVLIGMAADLRAQGRVHRAWWWALGLPWAALAIGEMLGSSAWATAVTAELVAGTPGAARPAEAFLPPM